MFVGSVACSFEVFDGRRLVHDLVRTLVGEAVDVVTRCDLGPDLESLVVGADLVFVCCSVEAGSL